jgi:hypothetical protein
MSDVGTGVDVVGTAPSGGPSAAPNQTTKMSIAITLAIQTVGRKKTGRVGGAGNINGVATDGSRDNGMPIFRMRIQLKVLVPSAKTIGNTERPHQPLVRFIDCISRKRVWAHNRQNAPSNRRDDIQIKTPA